MSALPVPADKFDIAALERAQTLGFPALDPHIPALLEWLQDPNWPVFQATADVLSDAGPALLPHLRAVLASDDTEWISAVLTGLCPRLDPDILARLAPDLAALQARTDNPDTANKITPLLSQ